MELDHDSGRLCVSLISPSWNWIDEDLWLLIFKRLPIETLCRFRCVSKSWNSVISSPFFFNLHHSSVSSATPPHLKPYLLLSNGADQNPDCNLYRPQSSALTEHLRTDLHFPFLTRDCVIDCVDVVRGVVCDSYSVVWAYDSTVVWNPAIRKFVALPRLPFPSHLSPFLFPYENLDAFSIGFGYDRRNNDFKVVRIHIPDDEQHISYDVYSPREGLWREGIVANIDLTSCLFNTEGTRTGCFVNGTIYWLLTTQPSPEIYSVLMFDCEFAEFTTMDLPREIYKEFSAEMVTYLQLLEHAGFLSVLVRRDSYLEHNFVELELWVMVEHGVWEKLYRIRDAHKLEMCKPAFGIRASFGPDQWIKFRLDQISRGYVYEESMFLMDDTNAWSYATGKSVRLQE